VLYVLANSPPTPALLVEFLPCGEAGITLLEGLRAEVLGHCCLAPSFLISYGLNCFACPSNQVRPVDSHAAATTENRSYVIRPQPQPAETSQHPAHEDELAVDHRCGQLNKQQVTPSAKHYHCQKQTYGLTHHCPPVMFEAQNARRPDFGSGWAEGPALFPLDEPV